MSLRPRTVFAIACDTPRCFETFHLAVGGEPYELQLQSMAAAEGWDEPLREHGWAVTNRHLCPACVEVQADQLTAAPAEQVATVKIAPDPSGLLAALRAPIDIRDASRAPESPADAPDRS